MIYLNCHTIQDTLHKNATIHQVTTMQATSKNVLSHVLTTMLTTSTDDPTL